MTVRQRSTVLFCARFGALPRTFFSKLLAPELKTEMPQKPPMTRPGGVPINTLATRIARLQQANKELEDEILVTKKALEKRKQEAATAATTTKKNYEEALKTSKAQSKQKYEAALKTERDAKEKANEALSALEEKTRNDAEVMKRKHEAALKAEQDAKSKANNSLTTLDQQNKKTKKYHEDAVKAEQEKFQTNKAKCEGGGCRSTRQAKEQNKIPKTNHEDALRAEQDKFKAEQDATKEAIAALDTFKQQSKTKANEAKEARAEADRTSSTTISRLRAQLARSRTTNNGILQQLLYIQPTLRTQRVI